MKKAKTKNGELARIYSEDGCEPYIYHGAIFTEDGWENSTWRADGSYHMHPSIYDLDLDSIESDQIVSEQALLDLGFKLTKHYDHDEYNTKRYELDYVHVEFTFIDDNLQTVDLTLEEVNCIDNPTVDLVKTLLTTFI